MYQNDQNLLEHSFTQADQISNTNSSLFNFIHIKRAHLLYKRTYQMLID